MAQTSPTIAREEGDAAGRYVIALGDGAEAEMTYRLRGDGTMVIDHTGVPPTHRGRGLAESLVQQAIADARAQGFKIVPVCSYVVAQFRRHPEWADLRSA